MDWFLYGRDLRHERVKFVMITHVYYVPLEFDLN